MRTCGWCGCLRSQVLTTCLGAPAADALQGFNERVSDDVSDVLATRPTGWVALGVSPALEDLRIRLGRLSHEVSPLVCSYLFRAFPGGAG